MAIDIETESRDFAYTMADTMTPIVSSPIVTSVLIAICIIVIILLVGGDSGRDIAKIAFYTVLVVTTVLFFHDYVIIKNEKHEQPIDYTTVNAPVLNVEGRGEAIRPRPVRVKRHVTLPKFNTVRNGDIEL